MFHYACHVSGQNGRMVARGDDAIVRMADPMLLLKVYGAFGMKLEIDVGERFEDL